MALHVDLGVVLSFCAVSVTAQPPWVPGTCFAGWPILTTWRMSFQPRLPTTTRGAGRLSARGTSGSSENIIRYRNDARSPVNTG